MGRRDDWVVREAGARPGHRSRGSTGAVRQNIERVIAGKPDVVTAALVVLLAEGHLLIEDVPGRRQDPAEQGAGPQHRLARCARIQFTPGPAALRRHRRLDLQPGHPRVRVPARRRVRQHRGRRRDQPGLAQDAVSPPRGHGGAPGHRRQRDLHAREAVHGHRDPEPDRDGGHVRPPGGAARPLHGARLGRLPGGGRGDRDARGRTPPTTRSTTSSRSPTPARSAR